MSVSKACSICLVILFTSISLIVLPGRYAFAARNHFAASTADEPNVAAGTPSFAFSTLPKGRSAAGLARDTEGNIYVTGSALSGFAATPGAAQTRYGGGESDAFVVKLNAAGTQVIYATYLGGSGYDSGAGIAVDAAGNACVAGTTSSADFPAVNAVQRVNGGGPTFKSENRGADWSLMASGLRSATVSKLVVDPVSTMTLYAGTTDGMFKSTNGGQDWSASSSGLTSLAIQALVIDPRNPATLYASTFTGPEHGNFKSADGGASWSALSLNMTVFAMTLAPANPQTIFAGGYTDDNSVGGVARSTNGGASWTELGTGLKGYGVRGIVIDPTDAATVYLAIAGPFDYGVFKSTDGGDHWEATGLRNVAAGGVALDPAHPARLYAATGLGADAFVARLNASGSAFFYSTYLGGMADESVGAVVVDAAGGAVVAGATRSPDFPLANALDAGFNGDSANAFITRLGPSPERAVPIINSVTISGKHLIVSGQNFSDGAVQRPSR